MKLYRESKAAYHQRKSVPKKPCRWAMTGTSAVQSRNSTGPNTLVWDSAQDGNQCQLQSGKIHCLRSVGNEGCDPAKNCTVDIKRRLKPTNKYAVVHGTKAADRSSNPSRVTLPKSSARRASHANFRMHVSVE